MATMPSEMGDGELWNKFADTGDRELYAEMKHREQRAERVMVYEFAVGQRVRTNDGREGEVSSCVPGNGIGWYFVQFDDGKEDRFLASWLTAI